MRGLVSGAIEAGLLALAIGCDAVPLRPEVQPEVQLYPAGVIAAARAEVPAQRLIPAAGEHDALTARVAWNFTDRRDFGKHDDEHGGGPGGGVGYRRYLGDPAQAPTWLYGVRTDLWWLNIEWEDDPSGGRPRRSGSTDVLVLQPTVEGGRVWPLGQGLALEITLALGAELNVKTDGEDVGHGAILLLGFALHGL